MAAPEATRSSFAPMPHPARKTAHHGQDTVVRSCSSRMNSTDPSSVLDAESAVHVAAHGPLLDARHGRATSAIPLAPSAGTSPELCTSTPTRWDVAGGSARPSRSDGGYCTRASSWRSPSASAAAVDSRAPASTSRSNGPGFAPGATPRGGRAGTPTCRGNGRVATGLRSTPTHGGIHGSADGPPRTTLIGVPVLPNRIGTPS